MCLYFYVYLVCVVLSFCSRWVSATLLLSVCCNTATSSRGSSTLPVRQSPLFLLNSDLDNSLDKLCHPRSIAYSAEQVLLNKQQVWCGRAYPDCYPDLHNYLWICLALHVFAQSFCFGLTSAAPKQKLASLLQFVLLILQYVVTLQWQFYIMLCMRVYYVWRLFMFS